jgi:hypothetical protein
MEIGAKKQKGFCNGLLSRLCLTAWSSKLPRSAIAPRAGRALALGMGDDPDRHRSGAPEVCVVAWYLDGPPDHERQRKSAIRALGDCLGHVRKRLAADTCDRIQIR